VQLEDYNYTTRRVSAREKEMYKYTLLINIERHNAMILIAVSDRAYPGISGFIRAI
jgi:hypothetical protein